MIKVLYVHNSLDLGGVQSVRYMFLKHLDSRALRINICCLGQKGELGRKIEELGYRVDAFNKPYGLFQLSTTIRLYRYIKDNGFDIVHSALFYANYHSALAAAWAKVPSLVTEEHGEHYLHSKRRHFIYRILGRQVSNKSNLILCCSDYVKQGIQRIYNVKKEKIAVLKNLIEDKKLEIKRSRGAIRTELNIPSDVIVVGTVSSLYWVKNQKILFDAISQLPDIKIFLVIAGGGPLKNELQEYAQKLGVVSKARFLGWRDDIVDVLNALDIFILPSLSEGLPICLLEAMSLGLPCIASRVGGIEEVLKDGVTGILVEPGNLGELTSALRRIVDDKELGKELGLSARRHVMEYFKPQDYVDKIIDLYVETQNFASLQSHKAKR